MTTTLAPAPRTTDDTRLAALLRADAVVTGLVGLVALAGPDLWGDLSRGVVRVVGVVLLVVAADLLLAARWTGRRLRLATTVCGELALAAAAACGLAAALTDLPAAGRELLAVVAVVSAGFGIAELRAVRTTR